MGIFLNSNGYYYVELTLNNKRVQKSLRTKSKVFAQDLYHVLLREQILQSFFPHTQSSSSNNPQLPTAPPIEIKQDKRKTRFTSNAINKYMKNCESRELGHRAIEDKKRTFKLLKEYKLVSFEDFSTNKIDKLWEALKDRYKDDSIRKVVSNLKAFLNWCIKQGFYSSDEINRLNFPRLTTKIRDKTYTPKQWQDIQELSKKDKDLNLYLKVLYYTGCRPNEIVNLRRQDIDDDGIIKIYQSKVKKYKYVSVPPVILDELLTFQDKIFDGFGKHIEFYSKKFRRIKIAMGLGIDYNLYTFRHTFATNLLNKTSDIHLVSKALGHSNIMMTSKHYANRSTKDIQDRVSVLWDES